MDLEDEVKYEEEEEEEQEEEEEEKEQELMCDMELLRNSFTPGPEGEVPLASYLTAYNEASKFVKGLGAMFHFVKNDIQRKVVLLRKKMAGENGQYYVDVRTMLAYEKEQGIAHQQSPQSGADALLQLHRALELTRDFMKDMTKEEEEPSLGQRTSEIYVATCGRFHPPILRVPFSAVLLMMMPDRATIRSRLSKGKQEGEAKLRRLLPEMIRSVTETYEACEALYLEHDLLHLDGR